MDDMLSLIYKASSDPYPYTARSSSRVWLEDLVPLLIHEVFMWIDMCCWLCSVTCLLLVQAQATRIYASSNMTTRLCTVPVSLSQDYVALRCFFVVRS
jgi:hypothetical protein